MRTWPYRDYRERAPREEAAAYKDHAVDPGDTDSEAAFDHAKQSLGHALDHAVIEPAQEAVDHEHAEAVNGGPGQKLGVWASFGWQHSSGNQLVKRSAQDLAWSPASRSGLCRIARCAKVIGHAERDAEDPGALARDLEVGRPDRAQSGARYGCRITRADGGNRALQGICNEPLRRSRDGLQEFQSVSKVAVGGVGGDPRAAGGPAQNNGIRPAFRCPRDLRVEQCLSKVTVTAARARFSGVCSVHLRRPLLTIRTIGKAILGTVDRLKCQGVWSKAKKKSFSMSESVYHPTTPELAKRRRELAPETHAAWDQFSNTVFADRALPEKTKQLIAVAVAHVTQCPYCIKGHTKLAKRKGASAEEIMEAIWVAAEIRAGGACAHSTLALHAIGEGIEASETG